VLDSKRILNSAVALGATGGLLALSSILAILYYLMHPELQAYFFSADTLIPEAFFQTLMSGDLAHWQNGHVAYLFPDLLFYALIRLLVQDVPSAIGVYAGLQYGLLVFGNVLLAWQVFRSVRIVVLSLLIAALALPVMLSVGQLSHHLFVMVIHGGGLAMTPYLLWGVLRLIEMEARPSSVWGMVEGATLLLVLAVLVGASDFLFVLHVVIPTALALGLLYLLSVVSVRQALIVGGVLAVASGFSRVIGTALDRVNSSGTYLGEPSPQILVMLNVWMQAVYGTWIATPVLSLVWLAFVLIAVGYTLHFIKRATLPQQLPSVVQRNGTLILVTLLVSLLASLVMRLTLGLDLRKLPNVGAPYDSLFNVIDRFVVIGTYYPLFFGWPFVVGLLASHPRGLSSRVWQGIVTAVFALTVVWVGNLARMTLPLGEVRRYSPDWVACVDQAAATRQLGYGLAGYWDARPLNLFSTQGIQVVQVTEGLEPYLWYNNAMDFDLPSAPMFVLTTQSSTLSRPTTQTTIERLGAPEDVFQCGELLGLVYPAERQVNRYLQASPVFMNVANGWR